MSVQTELHRHLDVSTRPSTLLELAQNLGLEGKSTSLEAFLDKLVMRKPLSDLSTVLAQFTLFQKVLHSPEILDRLAFEAVEDCWQEGTRVVEFRYSPSFVSEYSHLSWDDSLTALHQGLARGLAKYPEMKAGLICIASRDFGVDQVDQVVEFFLKNKTRFIGLDLAGPEVGYPCRLFEASFKKAIQAKANITIHAGEGSGPENVWEAVELLGAQRIGHGVNSIRDPELVKYLANNKICLEICPTSNWLTQAVPELEKHPVIELFRQNVPVSISTDDPSIFGVSLPHEYQVCRNRMGMTEAELTQCNNYAFENSFITGARKH